MHVQKEWPVGYICVSVGGGGDAGWESAWAAQLPAPAGGEAHSAALPLRSEDARKGLERRRRWSKDGFTEDKASGGKTHHPQLQNLELLRAAGA